MNERKRLQKELAVYLREKDQAELRELRARIHTARTKRRHLLSGAREQCRVSRELLKVRQAAERLAFRDEQRAAREAETSRAAFDALACFLQAVADLYLKELVKQQREHGKAVRKAGRYEQAPEKLRELLAGVPF